MSHNNLNQEGSPKKGILDRIQESKWYKGIGVSNGWKIFFSIFATLLVPVEGTMLFIYLATNQSWSATFMLLVLLGTGFYLVRLVGAKVKESWIPAFWYTLLISLVEGVVIAGMIRLSFPQLSMNSINLLQYVGVIFAVIAHMGWLWANRNWDEFKQILNDGFTISSDESANEPEIPELPEP